MGKSQETFGKKEKEKKRLKKRQDKEEKKEERKANSTKGQSLDQMLAYVDEYGNISSTPPDPAKKKKMEEEATNAELFNSGNAPQDTVRTGTVTFFNESKGYGFIKDKITQASLFVHVTGLEEPIKDADKVTYTIEMTHKGPNAVGVKKVVSSKA
jgi:cold shock CspA family protein